MNKMKEVINLLGLKVGEHFRIKGVPKKVYYFTMRGLFTTDDSEKGIMKVPYEVIINLLMNTDRIIKLPWMPKEDETYFLPNLCSKYDKTETLYNNGLICKTKDEAEKLQKDLIAYARKLRGLVD